MEKNKKGQIIFFILIGIIILFVFIFIIYNKFYYENSKIDETKSKIQDGQKLKILKSNVDHCIETALKKAVITSGLKGGFIYDKGEYYFPGTIPQNTYSPILISNFQLSWNYLQSKVLVESQAQVFIPGINKNIHNYNHSIQEDIKKYVSKDFIKCLNLENYNNTYQINYTDYLGEITNIDLPTKKIKVKNINAKLKDYIDIDFYQETRTGKVIDISPENIITIQFDNLSIISLLTTEELNNLEVYNQNNSLNLTININLESINAKLNYPVIIKSGSSIITYQDSNINLNVRLGAILDMTQTLLNEKYQFNKSIDYRNSTALTKALNNSEYFKQTPNKNIKLTQKSLMDSKEHKKFIYSFIDYDYPILGNPFVFNFGYENTAPYTNFNEVDPNFIFNETDNTITVLATVGDELHYNLRPFTYEKQLIDEKRFYFDEIFENRLDITFTLRKNGSMTIIPNREKLYTFNIDTTDGETTREHILRIITGFTNNENNKAITQCVQFNTYSDNQNLFPVNQIFNSYIFGFIKNDYANAFVFSNYNDNAQMTNLANFKPSNVSFSKSCVYDPNLFTIKANLKDSTRTTPITDITQDSNNYYIPIPNKKEKQELIINIINKQTLEEKTTPFNLTIYPSPCLGPDSQETSINATCCDIEGILNAINKTIYFNDSTYIENFLNLPSQNILKQGEDIFNKNIYFCFDYESFVKNNPDQIMWDIKDDITSFFEAPIIIQCKGLYPLPFYNINSIDSGSTDYTGTLQSIKNTYTQIPQDPINVNLKKLQDGISCHFCELQLSAEYKISTLYNSKIVDFKIGLPENNTVGIYQIPNDPDYINTYVLCNNDWLGKDTTGTWTKILSYPYGQGSSNPTNYYIDKGYCRHGTFTCNGRNSAYTYIAQDTANTCEDEYFNGNTIVKTSAPSSWQCNSGTQTITCNDISTGQTIQGTRNYIQYCSGNSMSCNGPITYSTPNCPSGYSFT